MPVPILRADVRPSNIKNILRGIQQLALAVTPTVNQAPYTAGSYGAGWEGTKLYAGPNVNQLGGAGGTATPFLAINRPQLAGYSVGGEPVSMDVARGVMSTEPYWDINVYAFHPFDPDNPNYDDATDDMNNLWRQFFNRPFLQYDSIIQANPAPTVDSFAVKAGDGARFAAKDTMLADNQLANVGSISGDLILLANSLDFPPNPGGIASQGTCVNSYPHSAMPDYVLLTDGSNSPWCVGFVTVRAFEDLAFDPQTQ